MRWTDRSQSDSNVTERLDTYEDVVTIIAFYVLSAFVLCVPTRTRGKLAARCPPPYRPHRPAPAIHTATGQLYPYTADPGRVWYNHVASMVG